MAKKDAASKRLAEEIAFAELLKKCRPSSRWKNCPLRLRRKNCLRCCSWDAACLYEIDLPRPRQEILQENRIIPKDEIAKKEKPSAEVEGMKKYLGL